MSRSRSISVVLPVLNEAKRIGAQLERLLSQSGLDEILVVDGHSEDATLRIARSFGSVRAVSAPRGRAAQMNAGAQLASGQVLLFLHADVTLPPNADTWIWDTLSTPGVIAGAFRTWTVCDDATARGQWLSPLLHLADLRSRFTSLPYGDQALFVRSEWFRRVGGFPEIPLMEDLVLARRLRGVGAIRTVPCSVLVSGRRFLHRPIAYTLAVNLFPLLFRAGVPPAVLERLYGEVR